MGKKKKNIVKVFVCGALSGALILSATNYYSGHILKKQTDDFKNQFSKPKFEKSFRDTKEVEQYSLDYYGHKMTIQSDSIKVYSFDENGNTIVEKGEKIEVPVENNDYLLDEYISEREANIYTILKNKDRIKDQFSIYLLFEQMQELYKEYLTRDSFETLENRKEAIYKVGYDYLVSDNSYTMGGYKYLELEKTIQKDILEIYQNINYMRQNGTVKEDSTIGKFIDNQEKVMKYQLFKVGRK